MPKKTDAEWVLIRKDAESGDYTLKALAEKHGLSVPGISQHRAKHGWTNPKTGEPFGQTARQKASMQEVPKGERLADQNLDVNAKVEEIKAAILAPEPDELERTQRELEEAKAELAALKPAQVEWPVDFETAARMAESEMDDKIQMELNSINDERAKRMLPYYTIADKDKAEPGWSKKIHDKIVEDMVSDLTRHATNDGPSLHKIDMLRPDGVTKEQIPVGPNIDNGQRPQRLLARGWRQLEPQSCRRWNCYGTIPEGDPYQGFHSQVHRALFDWQYPTPDRGVTTSAVFEG